MTGAPRALTLLVFASTGAAFLLAEIGVVNAFTVLFASPPVALSLVLGGMLGAAAVGGWCSRFLGRRGLAAALVAAAASLAALAALLAPGLRLLLPLSPVARAAAGLALLVAAPSLALGAVFPLAVRDLGGDAAGRAWAWAVNGSASVVASVAAALAAAAWGISALLWAAAAAYGLALAALPFAFSRARMAPRAAGAPLTPRAAPSTPPDQRR